MKGVLEKDKRQLAAFAIPPLLRLVQTVLLARIAGPDGLGVVFAALIIPNTLPRLLDLGLPHAAGYFLRRDARSAPAVVAAALMSAAMGGLAAAALLILVAGFPFPDARVNATLTELTALLAVYVAAQLARDVALASLVALEQSSRYLIASVSPVLLGPVGLILLAIWSDDPRPTALASVLVAAEIVGCALAVTSLMRRAGAPPAVRDGPMRELLAFGLRAFPGGAAKVVAIRADRLALVFLLSPSAYALYALSLSFRDATLLPSNAYGLALINRLTSQILADARGAWPIVKRALLVNAAMIAAILASFTLLAPLLIPALVGAAFGEAVPLMSVIVWSALLLSGSGVLWTWLIAAGRPGRMSLATVLASAVTVAVVLPLAYLRGVAGAAVGVLAAAALGLVMTALITRWSLSSARRDAAPRH